MAKLYSSAVSLAEQSQIANAKVLPLVAGSYIVLTHSDIALRAVCGEYKNPSLWIRTLLLAMLVIISLCSETAKYNYE